MNILEKINAVLTRFGEPIPSNVEPPIERIGSIKDTEIEELTPLDVERSSSVHDNDFVAGSERSNPDFVSLEDLKAEDMPAGDEMGLIEPGFEAQKNAADAKKPPVDISKMDLGVDAGTANEFNEGAGIITGDRFARERMDTANTVGGAGSALNENFIVGPDVNNTNPELFKPAAKIKSDRQLKEEFLQETFGASPADIEKVKALNDVSLDKVVASQGDKYAKWREAMAQKSIAAQEQLNKVAARRQADQTKIDEVRRDAMKKAA